MSNASSAQPLSPSSVTHHLSRTFFFAVFTLSGFAGLIYESIWSHYLRLFLGHAGYAQTLVLGIFMGGMAIGSWLAARYSHRWRNLLLGYVAAEAAIGLIALFFHPWFVATTEAAFDHVLPGLASAAAATAIKWSLGAALILPQTVLLGMTFPLMSGGLIRCYPAAPGATLAMLYFTNSLGAAAGVLVAGFVMVERLGLPGTMQAAGVLNLIVAAAVAVLARGAARAPVAAQPAAGGTSATPAEALRARRAAAFLLAAAALTGAASFIYEIAWIRMLTLVLGAATHSFELMLSAFILGLALGGLWMRGRIDRVDPWRFLGIVQLVMAFAALATLPLYGRTFELMQAAMQALARTDTGYTLYHFVSHGIALLVMFPAAFCAGMTLPLITCALLGSGRGEASIGAVYAANTLGAIAGVFVAAHLGLPLLGIKGTILLGAAIDAGLGLALLWTVLRASRAFAAAAAAAGAVFVAMLAGVELDTYRMMSGVFRHGDLYNAKDAKVFYYKDGRTASVSLVEFADGLSIRTNGKSDGGVNIKGPPLSDETTMTLTAALPLAIKPETRTVAVIGIGTGITTHVLLGSFQLEAVDTIEIEAAMAEASRGFRPRNTSTFADPRSHIHIDDAKTFFSTHNRRYDVIISEPSNPWVSGVASLFTLEFYRLARRHLAPTGILVQWLQLYETDVALLASVTAALGEVFPDYVIYTPNDKDLLIVAGEPAVLSRPLADVFGVPGLAKELRTVNLETVGDLDFRRLGGRTALEPLLASYGAPVNSDYYPHLDLNAPRLRFLRKEATEILSLGAESSILVELFEKTQPPRRPSTAVAPDFQKSEDLRRARYAAALLLSAVPPEPAGIPYTLQKDLELVHLRLVRCAEPATFDSWLHALYEVGVATVSRLPAGEARALWQKLAWGRCAADLPADHKRWLTLFKAIAERDAAMMAAVGEDLLAAPAAGLESAASRRYLLGITLAGQLAQGRHDAAQLVWQRYGGVAFRDKERPLGIELRFLQAHAAWAQVRAASGTASR
jgi:predicted membrane-bound spermidine synthase